MDYRLISKAFRCNNCNKRFRKLVDIFGIKTKCEECGSEEAQHMEESEFNREEADRTYRIAFDHTDENFERQFHPTTDLLDRDRSNIYGDARRISSHKRINASATGQVRDRSKRSSAPIAPTATGSRTSSTQTPTTSTVSRVPVYRQIYIPFTISPFRGSVRRQPMNFVVSNFFTDFFGFGMPNQDFFMDNFASNFSSNFEDPFTRIIFIQSMQNQQNGNPPTSKEAISKLKKFKMNDEFCKKDEKGSLEYPSCSVCLAEICKNEDTLLIPCGHMFHDGCLNKWLQMHNTCPVCRFELPTDDPEYERNRQERQRQNSDGRMNSRQDGRQ